MITVLLDKAEFEYDIHSLVKAFYPKESDRNYKMCSSRLYKPQGDQEQFKADTVSVIVRIYRSGASVGKSYRYPSDEDSDGAFRRG